MLTDNFADIPTSMIPLNQLEYDFENPRTQFYVDSKAAKGERPDSLSQSKLRFAQAEKTKKSFKQLLESIETKGMIEPVWVYKSDEDKYVVIEGNTRKLVYDQLAEKYPDDPKWKTIRVRILPDANLDESAAFLRLEAHLGGKLPWDPYERARYLYKLTNGNDGRYTTTRLANESRRNKSEIENDIKAFQLMTEQFLPKYGEKTDNPTSKYSYFVELLGNSEARKLIVQGKMSMDEFCSWVAEERIPMAINVRNLAAIFGEERALKDFKEIGYDEAMRELSRVRPDIASRLFSDIADVTKQLRNLRSSQISEIKDEPTKQDMVRDLIKEASNILRGN